MSLETQIDRNRRMRATAALALLALLLPVVSTAGVTEFCLDGKLDLGVRYQGMKPEPGESYATRWCVVTEHGTDRVIFSSSGMSNQHR